MGTPLYKISIITVCLNPGDGLKHTVASVLQQSYKNTEFIVIDGGSTDGSREYLTVLGSKVDIFVSEPDRGIYDAMNKGVGFATGTWSLFLNAGDQFASADVLKEVFRNDAAFDGYGIVSGRIQYAWKGRRLTMYRPILAGPEGPGLPHQATFVRSDILKRYPFDVRLRYTGDYDLWQRLRAVNLYQVKFINDVVSLFDLGGLSTNPKHEFRRYFERAFVDYCLSGRFGWREWWNIGSKVAIRRLAAVLFGYRGLFWLLRMRVTLLQRNAPRFSKD